MEIRCSECFRAMKTTDARRTVENSAAQLEHSKMAAVEKLPVFLLVVELTSEREVVLYASPRDEHRGVPHDAQQSEGRLQPRRGDVAGGAQDHGQEDQHADEGDGNEEPYEVTEEGEVEADFVSKVLLDLLHGTWFVTSG